MANPNLNFPVTYPPEGVTSKFVNPPNHVLLAYTAVISSLAFSTFFSWFRFLVKLCIVRITHAEDYFIPVAWLGAIGHATMAFLIYDFAPIIHGWDMRLETFGRYLLYFRLSALFYNISALFLKVSMLVQIRRTFVPRGTQPKTSYVLHFLIWANVLYYPTTMCLMMLNCRPLSKAWQPWLTGKCIDMGIIATSTASINLLSDLAILALTQRVIWNIMRIDKKQQLRLSVVFCAGVVPCGFAVLCLIFNVRMMNSSDFVFDAAIMGLACYGEITSGFFVLFLPVVLRFCSHIEKRFQQQKRARAPSRLDFADIGVDGMGSDTEERYEKSLWHISYTQKGGLEGSGEAVWHASHAVVPGKDSREFGFEGSSLSSSESPDF
ncbi:hypothetical protein K491DRAFT_716947 [Lophiostoma macrostomum CBS 122681]|uniref:Rhodopsin domain-containing protein n=1 Tax=Lophiostoma macrostomum CBS 122681 TaxID=1314788 RepID=A0A6A6T4V6_9PLEO|nr:hypothetical protein K491DRAFT_716947 [Lophiostoma macrostomum CBS 122681]